MKVSKIGKAMKEIVWIYRISGKLYLQKKLSGLHELWGLPFSTCVNIGNVVNWDFFFSFYRRTQYLLSRDVTRFSDNACKLVPAISGIRLITHKLFSIHIGITISINISDININ